MECPYIDLDYGLICPLQNFTARIYKVHSMVTKLLKSVEQLSLVFNLEKEIAEGIERDLGLRSVRLQTAQRRSFTHCLFQDKAGESWTVKQDSKWQVQDGL